MATRLRPPWLEPVSVDPALFVNRKKEAEELQNTLTDLVDYRATQALVLIGGDRGIGKSIFCRAIMNRVVQARPGRAIGVVVDARMNDRHHLVRRSAKLLAERVAANSALLQKDAEWLNSWVKPLDELASADRIQRGVSSGEAREYGAGSELAGGLWGVLQGKFSAQWKERREQGQRTELSLEVTTELRAEAIRALLNELKKDLSVLIFYDDLDQAVGMDNAENAKAVFRTMLDLAPAITLIHLRSEVKFPDIRREHDVQIDLGALNPVEMAELVRRRLQGALPPDRALVEGEGGWEPLRKLMAATGNPYVLLRWVAGLAIRSPTWPPPPSWTDERELAGLSVAVSGAPDSVRDELLRLGRVLDRLDKNSHFTEQELLSGRRAMDALPVGDRLDRVMLERLKLHELIMQVDRFDVSLGMRLDPLLELIRPSIARRVRDA